MTDNTPGTWGPVILGYLHRERFTARELIDSLSHAVGDEKLRLVLEAHWDKLNQGRDQEGRGFIDLDLPLILSRGYAATVPEDELSRYLPEEKILINKDMFRSHLDGLDFGSLDAVRERKLLETLEQDSIGLSADDVRLYFNLIKVNKLAGKSGKKIGIDTATPVDWAEIIIGLVEKQFGLNRDTWAKINSGKTPPRSALKFLVEDAIRKKRFNPAIFTHYLGYKNDKSMSILRDWLRLVVSSRAEDPQELVAMAGAYILINGASKQALDALDLSTPLMSFVTDRIGRVRTIYYVSLLFMHNLLYVVFAQIYEIAGKFYEVDAEQQKKLVKLYSSEDRLAMLLNNGVNLANRRIAEYKGELREVQNMFKKLTAMKKDFLTAADLFRTDYRQGA